MDKGQAELEQGGRSLLPPQDSPLTTQSDPDRFVLQYKKGLLIASWGPGKPPGPVKKNVPCSLQKL